MLMWIGYFLGPWQIAYDFLWEIHFVCIVLDADVSVEDLAKRTEGYSGAEICAVCKEAAIFALRDSIEAKTVNGKHFDSAYDLVKPRLDCNSIKYYEDFSAKFLWNYHPLNFYKFFDWFLSPFMPRADAYSDNFCGKSFPPFCPSYGLLPMD